MVWQYDPPRRSVWGKSEYHPSIRPNCRDRICASSWQLYWERVNQWNGDWLEMSFRWNGETDGWLYRKQLTKPIWYRIGIDLQWTEKCDEKESRYTRPVALYIPLYALYVLAQLQKQRGRLLVNRRRRGTPGWPVCRLWFVAKNWRSLLLKLNSLTAWLLCVPMPWIII